jgi:phage replication O-like protein O
MANPQIENGHTRVANEILNEIMKTNLNGTQFRLVLAIWRYTYGFRRKSYEMSITFLAGLIETTRSHVDRELKVLIDRNIITVLETSSKGARVLQFNKDYKSWSEREPGNTTVPDFNKKQSNKTRKKPAAKQQKFDQDNTYYKMATYFHKRISKVAKEAGVEHLVKKANLQNYADEFRKLIELDGVAKKQAKEVMDWVTQDPFWKTNILSARKLREKFAELAIKMNAQQKQTEPKNRPQDHRDKEIAFQQWIQNGGEPDEFKWNS